MMQACHLNTMLTYVDKTSDLQAQSDLACGIDVAYLATSWDSGMFREPTWAEAGVSYLFCSVDLPHSDLMTTCKLSKQRSCRVLGHVVAAWRSVRGRVRPSSGSLWINKTKYMYFSLSLGMFGQSKYRRKFHSSGQSHLLNTANFSSKFQSQFSFRANYRL